MSSPIRIVGAPGSPYSRKMRAVLRFRQIPYRWIQRGGQNDVDTPPVPVSLIPILVFPGPNDSYDDAMIDSTFQIARLEREYRDRTIVPPDPALAFVDALLEDYGDEWLTKAMFHYRWAYRADIDKAGAVLPRWSRTNAPEQQMREMGKFISERQIARLWVVGSNETTGPVIEESYRRLLRALDARLEESAFVLGDRPAACDFAIFGQLTQLAQFDPTPMAVTLAESPRAYAWLEQVEDLSGWIVTDESWLSRDAFPETLRALLAEAGRTYAPFLLGNAAALASGAEQVECEIDGRKWVQKPFPYQGKCLGWLRERYASLDAGDRAFLDSALAGTGCDALFA